MRIYNLLDVRGRKSQEYLPAHTNAPRRRMMPLASGGEDIVEISGMAMQLHRRDQVVALERARIEKAARTLMPEILDAMDAGYVMKGRAAGEDTAVIADEAISETADLLLGFLAG